MRAVEIAHAAVAVEPFCAVATVAIIRRWLPERRNECEAALRAQDGSYRWAVEPVTFRVARERPIVHRKRVGGEGGARALALRVGSRVARLLVCMRMRMCRCLSMCARRDYRAG